MSKYKNIHKNKDILKYVILFIVISFILSCSSNLGDKFQKLEQPKENEAIIYFYRPNMVAGSLANLTIKKDKNLIVKLPNQTYYIHYLKSGNKKFTTRNFSIKELNINIENGKIYFVETAINSCTFCTTPKIQQITNQEEALKELKQCRIVKKKEDIKPKEKEINSERINEICGDRCKIKTWETDTITKVNPIIKFGE